MVYGGAGSSPYLLLRRVQEFTDAVARVVPPDRLLVLDPDAPDAWARLCSFLGASSSTSGFRCSSSRAMSGALPKTKESGCWFLS